MSPMPFGNSGFPVIVDERKIIDRHIKGHQCLSAIRVSPSVLLSRVDIEMSRDSSGRQAEFWSD